MEISEDVMDFRTGYILGLSPEGRKDRNLYVGASDANIILGGDEEKIHKLWLVKTGQAEPDDLSDILAVQMGTFTEALNLMWFEKQTGCPVTDRGREVVHPHISWLRATLDGLTFHPENRQPATVDAKHVSPFNYDAQTILTRYSPQVVVQMACCDVDWGLLSIFSGNSKWEWVALERDALHEAAVIGALKAFWQHVQDKTPPTDIPLVAVPETPHVMMRSVDMSSSNSWCAMEDDYLNFEKASKAFESAKKGLKELVEADVKEAKGKLLTVRRGKTGALSFSRSK